MDASVALSPRTGVFLGPVRPLLPSREILRRWLEAGFDPPRCRAALEQIIAGRRLPAHLFDPAAIERGGVAASDALLFAAYAAPERFRLVVMRGQERAFTGAFPAGDVPGLAALVRAAAQGWEAAALRERFAGQVEEGVLDALCAGGAPPAARWPQPARPGVYRREHASLLVRSRETSVVLDPLRLAVGHFPAALAEAPLRPAGERADAVVITHTHEDHWHLPSVLQHAAGPEVPVIVPRVPRPSILSPEDPAATLALAGQRAEPPAWGAVLRLADMEIDVLPFYGEQPTRLPPGPEPALRNWGNCYRFNTPDFSALVLADSGADPAGDMARVVHQSCKERGPVDLLLSSLQEFPSPFFLGVSTECLTLPFARLRELWHDLLRGRLPSTTAGPAGVVHLCRWSGARHFLPYANGFTAAGRDNTIDWGAGPSEALVVAELGAQLAQEGLTTRALAWNPGDAVVVEGGVLRVLPYAAG